MVEAERVPAEGSGASGEAPRGRSAHRVKVGGKTRSGLSLTRPGAPTPFFLGEGNEKSQGEKKLAPVPCFLNQHWRNKRRPATVRDARPALSPSGVGKGRLAPPSPLRSAPSALGARSGAQACELQKLGARMRAVGSRFPPLSRARSLYPPPPKFLSRHL